MPDANHEQPRPTGAKLAIITGGSRGIGAATAQRFLADGWQAVSIARSPCPHESVEHLPLDLAACDWAALSQEVAQGGPTTAATPGTKGGGKRDGSDVAQALRSLRDRVAGSARTCLVHNAALNPRGGITALDVAAMDEAMRVNVLAPAALTTMLVGAMAPGSSVIFVGSTLSVKAIPDAVAYVTSKHGLVGLMRAVTQDLSGTGIHTACVCPGFTDTEMLRAMASREVLEALAAELVCMSRLIRPEEIAETVRFVADSPVLNGGVVQANLGQIER